MDLKALIGKLNAATRSYLEMAASMCVSQTHYDVEIEHYLLKSMESSSGDLARILDFFKISTSALAAELGQSLERLKRGNGRTPTFSPKLVAMFSKAWDIASIDFGAYDVRSGFTILALASDEELARFMRDVSREFPKIQPEVLRKNFQAIVDGSAEGAAAAAPAAEAPRTAPSGKTPNLDQYTINLTENARSWQAGSRPGPRFRNSPGDRYPDAPPAEQPDSHG